MGDAIEWRWVEIDGEQTVVTLAELKTLLENGTLSEHALVWRTGWSQWLPARNVAELSASLGSRAAPPLVPRAQPPGQPPPRPPLEAYGESPERKLRKAASVPPSISPPPRMTPTSARPRAGPVPVRNVLPTLADEPIPRSDTLRPAGATPPPPRGLRPQARLPSFDEIERQSLTTDPHITEMAADRQAIEEPAHPARVEGSVYGGLGRKQVWIATACGLALPVLCLVTLAVSANDSAEPSTDSAASASPAQTSRAEKRPKPEAKTTSPAASGTQASEATAKEPAPGCRIVKPARQLSERAYLGASPIVEGAPGSTDALVGFAARKTTAVGLRIELETLGTEETFRRSAAANIFSVVPLVKDSRVDFGVNDAGGLLDEARAVSSHRPFTLGLGQRGFARLQNNDIHTLWASTVPPPKITTPSVASVDSVGHAVTFRQGGQTGRIVTGWLDPSGRRHGYPEALQTSFDFVGTPSIAAGNRSILLSFAGRSSDDEPWRIALATAPHGEVPGVATPLSVPPGGPGGAAIAPTATGLDGGRFVLQWTEGSAGNRAVRVQVIDSNLVPDGEPVTLSPPERNAGQGMIWAGAGPRVLALFFVRTEAAYQLWGAALKCQ